MQKLAVAVYEKTLNPLLERGKMVRILTEEEDLTAEILAVV